MAGLRSAFTDKREAVKAAEDLAQKLAGSSPKAVVFFASHHHDGAVLSEHLRTAFPGAVVIGCTTAGEFTQGNTGVDGVTALALGTDKVKRCAGALARFEGGVEQGIRDATSKMAKALEVDLRKLDGTKYVGVVLVEGLKMREEAANEALGNVAPLLSFVGGSAGDNLEFKETRVFYNGQASADGAALLLLETAAPFTITKSCSFKPRGGALKVTKADVSQRVIYELDGKPVAQVYGEEVGVAATKLDGKIFMKHPFGLVIDKMPWIRSPMQLLPDGGLKFYCQIREGMMLHVMQPTDLIGETHVAIKGAAKLLGGEISGGLAFNCILRRLDLDAQNSHAAFLEVFGKSQIAGFHTYGESYLGHINQTLTALLFA